MTTFQRVEHILSGIIMLVCCGLMVYSPKEGYLTVTLFLSIALILIGLKYTFFYFTMARHMVGGKAMLFLGIIALDFGIFTASLSDFPRFYVLIYLLTIHLFSGIINILRSLEAKRLGATSWRLNFVHGVVNILMVVFCILFVKSTKVLVFVYCLGLINSSCIRIVSGFRKSDVVQL